MAGARTARPDQPDRLTVPGQPADSGQRANSLAERAERLAANHPSSPRFSADSAQSAESPSRRDVPPLDDAAYKAHTEMIETGIDDARALGHETDLMHTVDRQCKIWSPDRNDMHDALIDELYGAAANVPCDGKAVIAGGLGGAGKTTVLDRLAEIDRSEYLAINPDDIKDRMAERQMMPEVPGLSPMECSPLAHEESAHIARRLADKAYGDRKNVIWDITMSSRQSVEKRIDALSAAGYSEIVGVFVDIPAAKSVERALARHRSGMEDYRNGEGYGGRYVPPDLIRAQQRSDGTTVNREIFNGLKTRFDRWLEYDNGVDGRAPVLVLAGERREEG